MASVESLTGNKIRIRFRRTPEEKENSQKGKVNFLTLRNLAYVIGMDLG